MRKIILKHKGKILRYSDFGCSNGYLTNIFANMLNTKHNYGYDHSDNIHIARKKYNNIIFNKLDLNIINKFELKYDLITCLETIEHVGSIQNALTNLRDCLSSPGLIILSMPIETGFIGLIKYIIKDLFIDINYVYQFLILNTFTI